MSVPLQLTQWSSTEEGVPKNADGNDDDDEEEEEEGVAKEVEEEDDDEEVEEEDGFAFVAKEFIIDFFFSAISYDGMLARWFWSNSSTHTISHLMSIQSFFTWGEPINQVQVQVQVHRIE